MGYNDLAELLYKLRTNTQSVENVAEVLDRLLELMLNAELNRASLYA